jgi:hypothetical protein
MSQLDELLESLWSDHAAVAPQVARLHQLLRERGERVRSQHIALRTFDVPEVDIDALDRAFVAGGYEASHSYELPERKLIAYAYEHRDGRVPDLLISALLVDELSREARALVRDLVGHLEPGAAAHPGFALSGRRWPLSSSIYQQLRGESEYAAWVAAFGLRAHHFAIDASSLRTLDQAGLARFIAESGIAVASASIEDEPLDHVATVAEDVELELGDGSLVIPSCPCVFVGRAAGA